MRVEWDKKTRQRVRAITQAAAVKYGDPHDIAVGEYPDGRWWVRSLNEVKFGAEPFAEGSSLGALEVIVGA
jgi:hypothetical protein